MVGMSARAVRVCQGPIWWGLETIHTGQEMVDGAQLEYTGETVEVVVTYILSGPIYGLSDGWVIMSVKEAVG